MIVSEDVPKELKYAQDCYMESFNFLQNWKRRKVRQLVLLNNLQRGDQNIASTLLLTLFLRTLSTQYDDKIQVKFIPSQGITQEQLNSYNILAQSDYLEMGKAVIDYDACWDALFFNRAYIETLQFNKRRKIMEPCVINPLMFGYDPYFPEVQEWRYYWKWLTKSKTDIQRLIAMGVITGIKGPEDLMSGVDEYLWNYKILRDKAKQAIEPPSDSMGGDIFQILEFYCYDEDGDKCVYWIDRGFSKCLYKKKLDLEDMTYSEMGKEAKGSRWPITTKEIFRDPHASINFSLADILEDKHRAKSVLLNLAYIAAKDRANPLYWYNDNVTDVTQFMARQVDQHIKLEGQSTGDSSVGPINTEDPMSGGMIEFISMLQQEANAPIGTGVVLQPQKNKTSNTATEASIDQQLNDMAQSIQSKVMQFGESEFWSHWFHRYAKYGPELKDKMANIVGVKGIDSQMIDFKDFNTDFPPGVFVYSAKEAEYKNLVKRRDMQQNYPILAQTMDPDGFRNFNKHVYWPLVLEDPSLIDVMFPKTIDEMKAEEENEQLKKDEYVPVAPTDNHSSHIYTHAMLQPKTWALWFHLNEHEQALAEQKAQEMAAQQAAMMQGGEPSGQVLDSSAPSSGKIGAEKKDPMAAASPLKTEMKPGSSLVKNQAR